MGSFIFRCPHANLNVHEFALNSNDTAAVFEPIVCTAFGQVHLINAKLAKSLTGTLSCEQAKADLKRGGQVTGSYVDSKKFGLKEEGLPAVRPAALHVSVQ